MSRIFLVAAEASGDRIGGDLIDALRRREPALAFAGIGAAAMAERGVPSRIDTAGLAIVGLVEALAAWRRVVRLADDATAAILAFDPDVVVLIDSWGFTLRIAQRLRRAGARARLVKYVGPQVWATRPGRARTLSRAVDHLIAIHAFEAPFYAPFGLPVTVCGLPAFSRERRGEATQFRSRHNLAEAERVLLLLPGSRPAELKRIGPRFAQTARLVRQSRPDVRFACVAAESVAGMARDFASSVAPDVILVPEAEKENAFAAATAVLAASGTVTTEVALQGAPLVVGYVTGPVTAWIVLNVLLQSRFITLMNVAAGDMIVPEFIQDRCRPATLAAALAPLLDDPVARNAQVSAQNAALRSMGRGGPSASEIAAEVVLTEAARTTRR